MSLRLFPKLVFLHNVPHTKGNLLCGNRIRHVGFPDDGCIMIYEKLHARFLRVISRSPTNVMRGWRDRILFYAQYAVEKQNKVTDWYLEWVLCNNGRR